MSISEKVLERLSETLVIGFAVFLALVVLDRMSNTTYFRDNCWALFGLSVLIIAPILSALYHLLRWVNSRPQHSAAAAKS
ncbi:MAG TPA: hypothetical protein VKF79_09210 [Candidatus Acidoferrum sp.]|nr:hypothetical protein [Candidatus Acidoferrum sp.]